VEELQTKQDNLTINYYTKLRYSEPSSNFQILHLLNPKKIQELKNNYINGIDNIKQDLNWLYKLPKTDLHCHLGGFADTEGLIKIAIANLKYSGNTLEEKKLERSTINAIQKNDLNKLKAIWKTISTRENKVRWLLVSLYLRCFEGKEILLEQVIWNNLLQEDNFVDIGLENYEEIGDFQGSSLLQTEEALREICHQLKDDAKKNNLRYKELRCSPCNYTNKLKATEVVEILYDELIDEECVFRLIIIGSRHKSQRILKEHIDLCKNIKRENGKISDFICGFDLAGPEEKTTLSLREKILPLLEDCIRITIHSGETTSVKNIWEAVYNLNADRIGHGLYLQDDENLMLKLKENKTAIELCPSSNFQINSYRDYSINSTSKMRIYPLKQYLRKGIKACICSDDPGISRTDISKEYLKAAKMTKGGLSKWNILTIIRNGFVSSFQTRENKQKLISEAEKDIMKLV
jgi:adenosine deaminase